MPRPDQQIAIHALQWAKENRSELLDPVHPGLGPAHPRGTPEFRDLEVGMMRLLE